MKRLTIESQAQNLIDFYFQIGEEVQGRQGMVFPDMLPITANPDAEWAGPNPVRYSGNPLQVGQAPYAQLVIDLAESWYKDLGLFYGDWNIGDLLEYSMLTQMNTQIGKELSNVS